AAIVAAEREEIAEGRQGVGLGCDRDRGAVAVDRLVEIAQGRLGTSLAGQREEAARPGGERAIEPGRGGVRVARSEPHRAGEARVPAEAGGGDAPRDSRRIRRM